MLYHVRKGEIDNTKIVFSTGIYIYNNFLSRLNLLERKISDQII